jgi:maleylacetate reductase
MKAFVHEALPGRVVFGVGTVDRVADEVAGLSGPGGLGQPERVLVIASGSAKLTGDRIAEALGPRFAEALGEVRQHVPQELAAGARAIARSVDADAVVAVGGGSAIGLGKVVAVDLDMPLVAVPTTYSGSEMTPVYGITGKHKRTERDLRALPRVVVYDPTLTVDLPARITATSGFNALAHCVEGLYAPGANPVVTLWAGEGIRMLADALPRAVSEPFDLDARSDALYGGYLGGATLAAAGTALHHKLCHVLGGTFGLDHAGVHTVLLPHVAGFNAEAAPEALAEAAASLGGPAASNAVGGLLHDLAVRLGAPTSLVDLGMPADGIDQAAALGVTAVGTTNPRPVDEEAVRQLLQAAFEGGRP